MEEVTDVNDLINKKIDALLQMLPTVGDSNRQLARTMRGEKSIIYETC